MSTPSWAFCPIEYGGNQGQVGWKLIAFENHGINQPPFGYYDAEHNKSK